VFIPFRYSLNRKTGTYSAYRPPELLFSHTQYDPYALDSWALGCTLAGFFTGFVWLSGGHRNDAGSDEVGCAADEADGERSDERGREGYKVRRPREEEEDSEDESEDSESDALDGPIVLLSHRTSKANIKQKTTSRPASHQVAASGDTRGRWKRQTLFDGESGEIGLAWSIFRVMGTPGSEGGGEWKVSSRSFSVPREVETG
jgi:serine/threonine protein kinase